MLVADDFQAGGGGLAFALGKGFLLALRGSDVGTRQPGVTRKPAAASQRQGRHASLFHFQSKHLPKGQQGPPSPLPGLSRQAQRPGILSFGFQGSQ